MHSLSSGVYNFESGEGDKCIPQLFLFLTLLVLIISYYIDETYKFELRRVILILYNEMCNDIIMAVSSKIHYLSSHEKRL